MSTSFSVGAFLSGCNLASIAAKLPEQETPGKKLAGLVNPSAAPPQAAPPGKVVSLLSLDLSAIKPINPSHGFPNERPAGPGNGATPHSNPRQGQLGHPPGAPRGYDSGNSRVDASFPPSFPELEQRAAYTADYHGRGGTSAVHSQRDAYPTRYGDRYPVENHSNRGGGYPPRNEAGYPSYRTRGGRLSEDSSYPLYHSSDHWAGDDRRYPLELDDEYPPRYDSDYRDVDNYPLRRGSSHTSQSADRYPPFHDDRYSQRPAEEFTVPLLGDRPPRLYEHEPTVVYDYGEPEYKRPAYGGRGPIDDYPPRPEYEREPRCFPPREYEEEAARRPLKRPMEPSRDGSMNSVVYDEYGNALRKKRPLPPDGYEYVDESRVEEQGGGAGDGAEDTPAINDYYSKPLAGTAPQTATEEFLQNDFTDFDFDELSGSNIKGGRRGVKAAAPAMLIDRPKPNNHLDYQKPSERLVKGLKTNIEFTRFQKGSTLIHGTERAESLYAEEPHATRAVIVPIDTTAVGYDKTALQTLNEQYPGLEWEIIKQGPVHRPAYTAQVTIDGNTFCGFGTNKKEARIQCAESVVEAMALEGFGTNGGYTALANADLPKITNPLAVRESHLIRRAKRMKAQGKSSYLSTDKGKTHVQLIHEKCLGQKVEFELVGEERTSNNHVMFTMQCSINGTRFYGSAKDKKSARHNAALQALADLFNWVPPTEEEKNAEDWAKKETATRYATVIANATAAAAAAPPAMDESASVCSTQVGSTEAVAETEPATGTKPVTGPAADA